MAEKDFLDWFNQTVTILPFTGYSVRGEPTYGSGSSYPAMIQQKVKVIRNASGQEVVSTAQILVDGGVPVTSEDKILLADETPMLIHDVHVNVDETGQPHHKIIFA